MEEKVVVENITDSANVITVELTEPASTPVDDSSANESTEEPKADTSEETEAK